MYTSRTLRLTNAGNAAAAYEWKLKDNSHFSLDQMCGEVPAHSFLDVTIIYTPTGKF